MPAKTGLCRAEDTELIILFTVLGVLMLAGGGYAIHDGLPYLVLERGFTQVIIGTVVTVSGVIVLALARVLSELRRVRARLDMLNDMGSERVPAQAAAPSPAPEIQVPAQPDRPIVPEERGRALPAAIGLGAGALAGIGAMPATAGEVAERDGRVGTDSVGDAAEAAQDEPDLFASHLAEWDREAAQDEVEQVEAVSPEPEAPVADETNTDVSPVVPTALNEAEAEPVTSEDRAAVVVDGDRPSYVDDADKPEEQRGPVADPPADRFSAFSTDRSADLLADPLPPVVESEVDPDREPEIEEMPNPALGAEIAESARPDDDFGALRQSLSQSWTREDMGERAEPPLSAAEDRRLDEAGDWMEPASGRREPWFEPVLNPVDEGRPAPDGDDEAGDRLAPTMPPVVEEPPQETATAADDAGPAAQEPEQAHASDEGVVGAYQVGDAHFTIFADGSIKARTKEGDYSFASMEELKAYLASEKSRLGG